MRIITKTARLLGMAACFSVMSCAAVAHEVEHHWENPAYLGEMRIQVAAMMIAVFGAAACSWLLRVYRKRSREE